jgi:hypothetical protein
MSIRVRKPPSVADAKDFRGLEYFHGDLERILNKTADAELNFGSIAAGGSGTATIEVTGVRPDKGMAVSVGPPSGFNTGLVPFGYVSADDEVTIVLYNRTGGAIDPPAGVYGVRVFP